MKRLILIFICCVLSVVSQAQTLYVDSTAALGGNGGSWSTAFTELSDALDSAWHNPVIQEVFVAKGTYHPDRRPYEMDTNRLGAEFLAGPDENVTFHIRTGIELYGGFPNGGGLQNVSQNKTVLDGLLPNGDTVYRVCYIDSSVNWAASNDTTIVNGFTIKNGSVRDYGKLSLVNGMPFTLSSGGGISVYSGQFLVFDCIVTGNNSGISVEGGNGIIRNNVIQFNDTLMGGGNHFGGIGLHGADVIIENNLIADNNGIEYGGVGSEGVERSVIIIGNTFRNNYGSYNGGGYIATNFMIFEKNIIHSNSSNGIGGFALSSGSVRENLFISNSGYIGAAQLYGRTFFINNVVINNSGLNAGGIYTEFADSMVICNNTIVKNSNYGIRICCGDANFYNNVLWNNQKDFFWQSDIDTNTHVFKNNLLQEDSIQYVGTIYPILDSLDTDNLYNQNPLFIDINDPFGPDNIFGTADDGLHLNGNSPCIDSGRNSLVPAGIITDVTGAPRIANGIVNMGAYESLGWPTSVTHRSIDNELNIYPNPASQKITLEIEAEGILVLSDILGNKIKTILVESGNTQLDVSSLASGTYFIQLKSKGKSWNVKFIKK